MALSILPYSPITTTQASDSFPLRLLVGGIPATSQQQLPTTLTSLQVGSGWQTDRSANRCDVLIKLPSATQCPQTYQQGRSSKLRYIALTTRSVTHVALYEVSKYASVNAKPAVGGTQQQNPFQHFVGNPPTASATASQQPPPPSIDNCITAIVDSTNGQSANAARVLLHRSEVLNVYEHKAVFGGHNSGGGRMATQDSSALVEAGGAVPPVVGTQSTMMDKLTVPAKTVLLELPDPFTLPSAADGYVYLILRLSCSWEPAHPLGLDELYLLGEGTGLQLFQSQAIVQQQQAHEALPASQQLYHYSSSQQTQQHNGMLSQQLLTQNQQQSQRAATIIAAAADGYTKTRQLQHELDNLIKGSSGSTLDGAILDGINSISNGGGLGSFIKHADGGAELLGHFTAAPLVAHYAANTHYAPTVAQQHQQQHNVVVGVKREREDGNAITADGSMMGHHHTVIAQTLAAPTPQTATTTAPNTGPQYYGNPYAGGTFVPASVRSARSGGPSSNVSGGGGTINDTIIEGATLAVGSIQQHTTITSSGANGGGDDDTDVEGDDDTTTIHPPSSAAASAQANPYAKFAAVAATVTAPTAVCNNDDDDTDVEDGGVGGNSNHLPPNPPPQAHPHPQQQQYTAFGVSSAGVFIPSAAANKAATTAQPTQHPQPIAAAPIHTPPPPVVAAPPVTTTYQGNPYAGGVFVPRAAQHQQQHAAASVTPPPTPAVSVPPSPQQAPVQQQQAPPVTTPAGVFNPFIHGKLVGNHQQQQQQLTATSPSPAPTTAGGKPLTGVVFVLSGYVNPQRSQLRDAALALGAVCLPDWDHSKCTHLIVATAGTPKYLQVANAAPVPRPHVVYTVNEQWILAASASKTRPPESGYYVGVGMFQ